MNNFHFASVTANHIALLGPSPPICSNSPCRVVVLDKVTDLLLFFGKLLVVGGVGKDQGRSYKDKEGGAGKLKR